ncbi:Golgin subfamily B member 1 [Labeo rohita]|uniref:Golgin subfamily B member 1 n=1 Tax=Labeo rohita TaxID=84645 RepID=A0ABQ8LKI2_LABRO|nr:Golgin subfamily B member 1 [Labeo rohita]
MPFASSSPLAIRQEDDEMLIKECCACGGPVELPDAHDACVFCLGRVHTEAVLDGPDCPICEEMTVKTLRARVSVILNCVPANPLDDARDLVSFGAAEDDLDDDDDAMSTAASGSGDWSACLESEASHSEVREPPAPIDEELVKILSEAVQDLGLDWSPPEHPTKNRLDMRYLQSGRQVGAPQRPAPFFPEVHEEISRSWRSPYSARAQAAGSRMLSSVDGADRWGYTKPPPVEEAVAAHLCPSAPKMLQTLDEEGPDSAAFKKLYSATDLALRATKKTAQGIGRCMGSLVTLQRHLWLMLTDMRESEKAQLDAVGSFSEKFLEAQKQSKAMSHFLLKRDRSAAPPPRSRSSSLQCSKRRERPPPTPSSGARVDPEPAIHSSVPDCGGLRRKRPPSEDYAASTAENQRREGDCASCSAELAQPAVVSGVGRAPNGSPVANSVMERSLISGKRLGVAPQAGAMEPACLAGLLGCWVHAIYSKSVCGYYVSFPFAYR